MTMNIGFRAKQLITEGRAEAEFPEAMAPGAAENEQSSREQPKGSLRNRALSCRR